MFTGIVEEVGTVQRAEPNRLVIAGPLVTADLQRGASVAVAGVCLTVADLGAGTFTADVMPETLARTTLGRLRPGARVNLERALRADSRLGGHIVQGHVDGLARLLHRSPAADFETFEFAAPAHQGRYLAAKGSVALDGTSLTVIAPTDDAAPGSRTKTTFQIGLIPTTLQATTLGLLQPGDEVNVEVDVLAKYVERLGGQP
ncbi:MAG: riboflavin synthase [Bifidobacteriaceae bacterium]|jgi:riboflavin synthase|nr:riboflavin synthase [Bifidobacteriaceae bacterium]